MAAQTRETGKMEEKGNLMAQAIDLGGIPEPVARAITETVHNLKMCYRARPSERLTPLRELPSRPGKVIGSLRRVDLYDER